jgi:tetratricopeptide (TPR) repeat protein
MRWILLVVVLGGTGCLDADRLLREGRAPELLARVRPVRAIDYRRRALALRAVGRPRQAAEELRIAVVLDPGSAESHRALGFVEAQLGMRGAALRAFEQAHQLDRRDPTSRAALARLLIARGYQRSEVAAALADLARAVELDPSARSLAGLARRPAQGRGGICPGPPSSSRPGILPPARCKLEAPIRLLEQLERRDLLVECQGAQLATRLLAAGCPRVALAIWERLEREAPSDPRWPLQAGAAWLSLGEVERARLRFVEASFLSRDRPAALLTIARLHLEARLPRLAGGYTVDALAFPLSLGQRVEAVRLLAASGHPEQAREVARAALDAARAVGARVEERVRLELEAAGSPRSRPASRPSLDREGATSPDGAR